MFRPFCQQLARAPITDSDVVIPPAAIHPAGVSEPTNFRVQSRLQRFGPKRIVHVIDARSRYAASVRPAVNRCFGSIQIKDVGQKGEDL